MKLPTPDHLLFIFISITIASLLLTCCRASHGIISCDENEKQSLLRFKQSAEDPSVKPGPLSSWISEIDCCSWDGVLCNNETGHVLELNLPFRGLNGELVPDSLFNLTHLTRLDLGGNAIHGALPSVANFTKLQYFDITENYFNSTIPDWLYDCKYLEHLSLGRNSLHGSISNSIGNLTSLNWLDTSDNNLSGEIPSSIANLCIQTMYLANNMFTGDISNVFGNISICFLESLVRLTLNDNLLSGNLKYQFGEFKSLVSIYLEHNKLSGPLPNNLGNLVSLKVFVLSDNKFTGNLPESMGQLVNLTDFDVSNNILEGIVSETHFANLSKLEFFIASGNHLTFKVSDNWIPSFKLASLCLGSWNIGAEGRIPEWINTQKGRMDTLDLSNTGIAIEYDLVPSWLWEIDYSLNLSHNKLSGTFHDDVILSCVRIDLSSNMFSGSPPRIDVTTVLMLDLSNNSFSRRLDEFLCDNYPPVEADRPLWYLNLEGNMFSGGLPDCLMKFDSLVVLNLANNNISGRIPKYIGKFGELEVLNLFRNRLSGHIPSSMQNCTKLWKIDLSNNQLIGKIPVWMGTDMLELNILILRSNQFDGKLFTGICHLRKLRILDLADNNLSGIIPRCVDNFTAMSSSEWIIPFHRNPTAYYSELQDSATVATKGMRLHYDTILALVTNIDLSSNKLSGDIPKQLTSLAQLRSLNFSRNRLSGKLPDGIEDMKVLESLDLSNNFLIGKIPQSIGLLSSLSYLDLSYNNLSGEIPPGTQIMTFPPSWFAGNTLCGPPLPSKCNAGEIPGGSGSRGHEKDDQGGKLEVEWLYVFVSIGYAVGLAMVFNVLIFNKSWRDTFFWSVDNMWNKCLYAYKKRNIRG